MGNFVQRPALYSALVQWTAGRAQQQTPVRTLRRIKTGLRVIGIVYLIISLELGP